MGWTGTADVNARGAILTVRVRGGDAVRIQYDDGRESQLEQVRLDAPQIRMVELFQDWLSEGWAKPSRRKITRRRELETLGMLLFARMFPGSLSADLDAARAAAVAEAPARVELTFDDGAERLAALPWEYLYRPGNGSGGYFLATDARLALSRYIPLNRAIKPLDPADGPLRILATAARPRDLKPVREAPTLDALQSLARTAEVEVHVLDHPTPDRLLAQLASVRPHVLHVLAHGEQSDVGGRIALESDGGDSFWLADHAFAALLEDAGPLPHIVLLHACEGGAVGFSSTLAGFAPTVTHAGVQAVIAMQYPLTNRAASAFAVAFYAQLADARSIEAAVQRARLRMTDGPAGYDTGEFGIPVLYLRSKESTPVLVR
jgi:DUF971 family protein